MLPNGFKFAQISYMNKCIPSNILQCLLLIELCESSLPTTSGVTLYQGAPGSKFLKAPPSRSAKGIS